MQILEQSLDFTPNPDFEGRFKKALLRQGEPDRVPMSDFSIDVLIKREFLRRELGADVSVQDDGHRAGRLYGKGKLPLDLEVEFAYRAGLDFIRLEAGIQQKTAAVQGVAQVVQAKYAAFGDEEQERGWANEGDGVITNMEEFKAFPWPDPDEMDYSAFEEVKKHLKPGMKVVLGLGKVFTGVWWLMGMECFCRATRNDPGLIKAMYEKVGEAQMRVLDIATRFDCVGAVVHADDIAYAQGLMINPKHYREHFFPWLKAAVDLCHSRGIPFIYHTDGDVRMVLDDIVACGVDALHPIEPKAMDIVWLKEHYGDKLALMGNIDLGYTLTRGTPEEVEEEVKLRIKQLAPGGGYLCGASNSVPEYVPFENFMAMRNAILKYGKYPIQLD
ncbi:MAG TPA: uroporphyrinogen decarboxylase family protein [Chloroflexota bacterium]